MSAIKNILLDAAKRGIRYREKIADRGVAPTAEAVAAVAGFVIGGSMPVTTAMA